MSLLYYESAFSRLNPNRARGNVSPHKIAMLLAVLDLIEFGALTENEIKFSESLTQAFTKHFNDLKSDSDRDNPHLPFFHLRGEGFWHHEVIPGKLDSYSKLTSAGGPGVIRENIRFAYLDDELFELLQNRVVRELLKTALYRNFELTPTSRQKILEVEGWNWLECEACVADYFTMLHDELAGKKYSKAAHRRALIGNLSNRSEGSIEFKHQNISAVLVEMGFPYISGYKPRFNYQSQLKEVVLAHLAANQNEIDIISTIEEAPQPHFTANWENVLDNELPERIASINPPKRRYLARKTNYSKREASNRKLGENGEAFVIEFEKYRLRKLGREDLADEVKWSSKEEGDGLGYDVRSFAIEDGTAKDKELFIEVKTTNSGKYQPFLITDNELAFSREFAESYSLYRVYDFKERARLFQMPGEIEKFVNLRPELFRASFST